LSIEDRFDVSFIARLTAEEKQIQQNYRPVIGVHKWFARRPGALFRGLLLSEFVPDMPLSESYLKGHALQNVTICDPFMGGGTTLFESNRVGCNVASFDINPMAYWVVRQELGPLDRPAFRREAEAVIADVQTQIAELYATRCLKCREQVVVKYFLWVKQHRCDCCGKDLDLFPGYLIAKNDRHTHFVLHCPSCDRVIEVEQFPEKGTKVRCPDCLVSFDPRTGTSSRNRYTCASCKHEGHYPADPREAGPPRHRLFAMEYHCKWCDTGRKGRFFKAPDKDDLGRFKRAAAELATRTDLQVPDDEILDGDETKRLHRWGYRRYREMFNERQLFSLAVLLERIKSVKTLESRHALATVFSDCLRYQNMLCRYDEYALKCQDIFAVHGFPVGLIQCENNPIGLPGIGAGGFRHFIEKYDRAKAYCEVPFETVKTGKNRKKLLPIDGEKIEATFVGKPSDLRGSRKALLKAGSIEDVDFSPATFDAIFTDPPYFDNVQYAELMDFCYCWLRILLNGEFKQFTAENTRSLRELTGNNTTGKDLAHFTEGLSLVFSKAAAGLKDGAPLAFTYHHNDVDAYVPVVVAILDAGLSCTATIPCPAEMTASLHINGTGSSVIDSIIVSRKLKEPAKPIRTGRSTLYRWLEDDRRQLGLGGVKTTKGDLYCLALGHLARVVISVLRNDWIASRSVNEKMAEARAGLDGLVAKTEMQQVVDELSVLPGPDIVVGGASKKSQRGLFD
jgi:adenine-specific DNA methylase